MFDWAIVGVNVSLPGEGGPECVAYLPLSTRIYESVVVLGIALSVFIWARSHPVLSRIFLCQRSECKIYREQHSQDHRVVETTKRLDVPSGSDEWNNKKVEDDNTENENLIKDNRSLCPLNYCSENKLIRESLQERNKKNWLLILLCLIWGAEIGFKFASQTVIYLLNPCHVVTAVQIYLLSAQPSSQLTAIFRIHLYFLNGAILAFLFPNTESRMLPCESSLYWIQHCMMLIVPIYLFCQKGVYNVEPFRDLSWGIFSYAINIVYHFAFLQPIAMISEVNLNQLLCPAQLDPFRGMYYRTAAVIHQSILCPLVAKACAICASFLISSSTVNAEFTFGHKHQVLNTHSCDNNIYRMSEKENLQKNSIGGCKSCYEKDADFVSNLNHKVDSHVPRLENVNEKVANPLDKLNNLKQDSFHLRQRKTSNEVENS